MIYPSTVPAYFPCRRTCGNGLYADFNSADGLSGIYLLKTGTCQDSTETKPVFEAVRFTIAKRGLFVCRTH